MKNDNDMEKLTGDFIERLMDALDKEGAVKKNGNSFFSSPLWCFLAFLSLLINFIMVAVIFWQRLRIDYLVTKIIGE